MQIPTEGLGTCENWAAMDGISYHGRYSNAHTHTPHTPHKQRHKLKTILESSALLNYDDDDDDAFAVLCLLFIYVEMTGFVNQIHKFRLVTNNFIYTI